MTHEDTKAMKARNETGRALMRAMGRKKDRPGLTLVLCVAGLVTAFIVGYVLG